MLWRDNYRLGNVLTYICKLQRTAGRIKPDEILRSTWPRFAELLTELNQAVSAYSNLGNFSFIKAKFILKFYFANNVVLSV